MLGKKLNFNKLLIMFYLQSNPIVQLNNITESISSVTDNFSSISENITNLVQNRASEIIEFLPLFENVLNETSLNLLNSTFNFHHETTTTRLQFSTESPVTASSDVCYNLKQTLKDSENQLSAINLVITKIENDSQIFINILNELKKYISERDIDLTSLQNLSLSAAIDLLMNALTENDSLLKELSETESSLGLQLSELIILKNIQCPVDDC
jgi:hypothetical protein